VRRRDCELGRLLVGGGIAHQNERIRTWKADLGGEPAGDYLNDIRMVTEVSARDSTSPKTVTANCASGEEIVGALPTSRAARHPRTSS
jgi:hypothetical protein